MRTLVKLIALTLTLSIVVCASALASGTPGYESVIKLRDSFPAFHGKVLSEFEDCVAGRTVKMFKLRRSGDKKLLGSAMTDSDGKWEVLVDPLKSGAYFAIAQRSGGTMYECTRAKSKTEVVD